MEDNNNKSTLTSLTNRLKTTSTQMTRLLSQRVNQAKDFFQTPTPESRLVDQATSPALESPDWALNLRICSLINSNEISSSQVTKSIKRRFSSFNQDAKSVMLGLELLEACAMNCDKVFSEIASEKVVEDMVGCLIENEDADRECRVRAMELVRAWGESEELSYLPVFRQTYENLKGRVMSSHMEEGSFPATLESYIGQNSVSPPESYPIPGTGADEASNVISSYHYGSLSAEQKKEFLEITKNSLEVLSSLLSSSSEPKVVEDELTISMLDKCKESRPVLQRIVQSTTDDEGMLFEALNLNDELQKVVSKFEEMQFSAQPNMQQSDDPKESSSVDVLTSPEPVDVNKPTEALQGEKSKSDLPDLLDGGTASGSVKK